MGDEKEPTPGGSRVLRHDTLAANVPPISTGDPVIIEAIQTHISRHLGGETKVLHEIISPFVHLDLHVVPPSPQRPFYTLVTSGMSERTLKIPPGSPEPDRIELVLCLPADWTFEESSVANALNHWSVKALKMIARLPHAVESWLAEGHTIPNDEAGSPYHSDTNMCCALVAKSVTTPDSFHVLQLPNQTRIHFFGLWFLTKEEMEFKLQHGYEAILQRLVGNNCSELLELCRDKTITKLTIPEDFFGSSFASRPAGIKTRWEDLQRTLRIFINPTLILFAIGSTLTASGIASAYFSKPAPGMVIAGIIALVLAAALGMFTWKLIRNMRIVFQHGLLLPGVVVNDKETFVVATLVNLSHSGSQPWYVVSVTSQMLSPNRALSLFQGARVPLVCSFRRPPDGAPVDPWDGGEVWIWTSRRRAIRIPQCWTG